MCCAHFAARYLETELCKIKAILTSTASPGVAPTCGVLAFTRALRQVTPMILRLFWAAAAPSSTAENLADSAPCAVVQATPGQRLAQAIWLSGEVPPVPMCGGLGRCGRCRVRFMKTSPPVLPEEEAVFSAAELAHGWRLACRRQVPDAPALDLALPPEHHAAPAAALPACSPASPKQSLPELALAVDLGTTSLFWRALHMDGSLAAEGRALNPQAGAGPDVMSRLAVAREPQGRGVLARLARRERARIVEGLARTGRGVVSHVCLAANTAMTDIFLDRDVEGLCAAPYKLAHHGDETALLPGLPPVYIPPLPAPFVGGDISAGLLALREADTPRPFVLADLGTNGELALVDAQDRLWLASVPLGPALEGIGPQCGQLAGPGVVTGFSLTPLGLAARFYEDGEANAEVIAKINAETAAGQDAATGFAPRGGPAGNVLHGSGCSCPACGKAGTGGQAPAAGISATGYLSLLALLLRAGVLREDGGFVASPAMPLAKNLAACLEPGPTPKAGARLGLPHGLWLAAADVEELLKVKAAFALALEALLRAANLSAGQVAVLCLAGSLGEHADPDDLETLGFVPPVLARRLRAVGNTSLNGAAALARHAEKGAELARLCRGATLLPLVDEPNFHTEYLRHMRFGA